MRSVYYSADAELISSHAHLVAEIQEHTPRTPDQGANGCLKSWDRTPWLGISGLLPNHELAVPGFAVARFFPRAENPYRRWSVKDRVAAYVVLAQREWRQFEQCGFEPVLSVTGGHDSRTNLALVSPHSEKIRTFTYAASETMKSAWADSTRMDRRIVEELKQCIPLDHRFFEIHASDRKSEEIPRDLLTRNTLGNHGTWLLPFYLQHFSNENAIHVRGNTYGVYKAPWNAAEDNNDIAGLRTLHRMLTRGDRGHETPESREAHFVDGVRRWGYDGDLFGYHRNELLYWEMRLGRWASEIYNETDLAFPTFDPTNVRTMLEIALSFTLDEKRDKVFQSEVVNAAYPLLNFPGKNQAENLYEQTRHLLRTPPTPPHSSGDSHGTVPTAAPPVAPNTHCTGGPGASMEHSSGPHRFPSERPLYLRPGMTISRDGVSIARITTGETELYVPSDYFTLGTVSAKAFEAPGARGTLTFTLESDYAKYEARDSWFYSVSVDGVVRARWDGALRRRPVHVTVENVNARTTVEVCAVALRDRVGIPSWEKATRAWVTSPVLTAHELPGPLIVSTDVPGSELESTPELLRIPIENLAELSVDEFASDIPRRVDVITSHCVIPLLVVRRATAKRTTIWVNGAVDLERSGRKPVFEWSSCWPELPHHQIFVCDPATVGTAALPIAWGQYSPEYWFVPDASRAVSAISAVLGVADGDRREYVGSSAGGFLALALACRDAGSRTLVDNAPFDWASCSSNALGVVRSGRLRNISLEKLRLVEPGRLDVLGHWASLPEPPRLRYLVNMAEPQHRDVTLPRIEELLVNRPDLTARLTCERYDDETAGTALLSRERAVALLAKPYA
ncbi:hypothetical protein GCM10025781_19100 [Kocuria gwangalliensis]|uniref:Uncharacterized protein n=1 Tax=Kocuria gwangalliensis TaxID=501592 RepID=A0ABP8X8A0_9MICC